jgi:hypothetical protein
MHDGPSAEWGDMPDAESPRDDGDTYVETRLPFTPRPERRSGAVPRFTPIPEPSPSVPGIAFDVEASGAFAAPRAERPEGRERAFLVATYMHVVVTAFSLGIAIGLLVMVVRRATPAPLVAPAAAPVAEIAPVASPVVAMAAPPAPLEPPHMPPTRPHHRHHHAAKWKRDAVAATPTSTSTPTPTARPARSAPADDAKAAADLARGQLEAAMR